MPLQACSKTAVKLEEMAQLLQQLALEKVGIIPSLCYLAKQNLPCPTVVVSGRHRHRHAGCIGNTANATGWPAGRLAGCWA